MERAAEHNRLLVIMPAHNEEANIGRFLDKLEESGCFTYADVLVINDGSTDFTREIVNSRGVRLVNHPYNMGYGAALQTGYKYAVRNNYGYLIQLDSDGQHDVANIPLMYDMMREKEDECDIVIGSRFMAGSKTYRVSGLRRFMIVLFCFLIRVFTGAVITDPTSGLQGLNRRAFSHYAIFDNFAVDYPDANMIIQMLLRNFRIAEVPAIMHPRIAGVSLHSGLKPVGYVIKMTLNILVVVVSETKLVRRIFRRNYSDDGRQAS